jgi:Dolichyl-phosphate-mannose-protein mannosyltransferase
MEKMKGRVPASPEKSASAPAEETPGLPWTLTWCFLAVLFLSLVWYPASKLSAHYSFGSNEGFNTTFEATAAAGGKIYGNPPVYLYANYPPVSFHLIAWLAAVTHDLNLTGRWISFFAYFAIGGLIALTVERLGRSWRFAAYAGLCWLIWMPAFDVGRVGLNDPHLLGVALSLTGLYCFVRDPESTRWLCISAVVFAVSLFTKQSLISFPAAVAIQLLLTSRKRLAIWLGTAAVACVILLLLTLAVDGKYFLDHLMLPRAYYVSDIWSSLGSYLYFVQVAFVVAVIWALRVKSIAYNGFLLWGFPIAHAVGAFYCGGAGAGVNHLFDAMILTAIIVGLVLPGLPKAIEGTRFPSAALTFMLIVPFFLTSIVVLARRLPADLGHNPNETAQAEAEFTGVSDFLRSRPGPALCESLLLCLAADKPVTYDPFVADQLIRTGKIPQEQVVQLIASRQFAVIQIDWNANEPMQPSPRTRFSGPVMRALFSGYQLALRSGRYAVFTPRP